MTRVGLYLIIALVASALGTVASNNQARKLFAEMEREQGRMRALEVEWGQLQLEQGTWANHARVEKIARRTLHMAVPMPERTLVVEVSAGAAGARP